MSKIIMMFLKQIIFLNVFNLVFSANPENVTCTLDSITSTQLTMNCWIYPSGVLKEININNKIYSTSSNDSCVSSTCQLILPQQGQLYPATKCWVYVNVTILAIGNNHINVSASSDITDSMFLKSSNLIFIHVYDDLQKPVCRQPVLDDHVLDNLGFATGVDFNVKCLAPLTLGKIRCTAYSRTNGTVLKQQEGLVEYVLDEGYTVAVQCKYSESTSYVGHGQQEFKAIMFRIDSEGKKINNISSDWTSPVNFYLPTDINFTINGSPEGVILNVGDNYTFNCSINSFPPPLILVAGEHENEDPLITWTHRSLSTIISTSIQFCGESDSYTCKIGWSGPTLGGIFSKTVYMYVPCRYRFRSDKYQESNKLFLGTFTNVTNITFQVFGYPTPISMRLSNSLYSNKFLSEEDGVHIVFSEESGPYGTIEINFNNTDLIRNKEHFILTVDNAVGSSYFDFYLGVNDKSSVTVKIESTSSLFLLLVYLISYFII